jgi:aquaporin Z
MKKYIVEFIGTFFLVLAVVCAVNGLGDNSFMAPIAIGSALMVMIYAGGHISGAHYNPAVSIAVLIRGKMDSKDFAPYIIAQILGGSLAALIASKVFGFTGTAGSLAVAPALLAEILGTFALAYVILNVATTKSNEGNSFYGLAIGFTVTAMAYTLGGISGGAFNPAVAIGITLAEMAVWGDIWIYLLGTVAGGVLAAIVFGITYGKGD